MELLDPVKHKWEIIGVRLCIENSHLECIEESKHHNNERLLQMLELWINQRKCMVSWKTIIDVIKDPPISNVRVATEICQFLLNEYNSGQQGIYSINSFTVDIT